MNTRKQYTQQTITRVVDFGRRHADLFPKKSVAGELLDELEQDMNNLGEHLSGQVFGNGAIRKSKVSRNAAHDALLFKLERIDQTARALKLSGFFMPRSRSGNALIQTGAAFASEAEPLKAEFIKQGLSSGFVEGLKTAVQDLDSAMRDQAMNVEKRKASIIAFDNAMKKTSDDLARFDSLVANTLSDNAEVMAEWEHARRVGRPPARRKKNPEAPEPPPPQPAPATAA